MYRGRFSHVVGHGGYRWEDGCVGLDDRGLTPSRRRSLHGVQWHATASLRALHRDPLTHDRYAADLGEQSQVSGVSGVPSKLASFHPQTGPEVADHSVVQPPGSDRARRRRQVGCWAVERVTRIELALSAWEADVLPLNYTREPALRANSSDRTTMIMPHLYPPGPRGITCLVVSPRAPLRP